MLRIRLRRPRAVVVGLAALLLAPACATGSPLRTPVPGADSNRSVRISVVAAENVWGSIAGQIGGDRVEVTSIVSGPDADPHDYEPTPADARLVARSPYVIANGLGYDPWIPRLVDANADPARVVLDIGTMLGLRDGDNPHRWYFPDDVKQVVHRIADDYRKLDPADAAYFDAQEQQYLTRGLARYDGLLASIKREYAGTRVGASESIFVGLAEATGLDLVTPPSFLDAISEGNDPTAKDKAVVDEQITTHEITVLVFNSQNSTPDVQRLVDAARAAGVAVTDVTETLVPADATFQDWQVAQLQRLADALRAGGNPK